MSGSDKPAKVDPARAWDAVQKMVDDDEIERVMALSPEEVSRELEEQGWSPADRPEIDALVARARALAGETSRADRALASRRPAARVRALVWLAAAALVALVVALAIGRRETVAHRPPPSVAPVTPPAPVPSRIEAPAPAPPREPAPVPRNEWGGEKPPLWKPAGKPRAN